MKQPARMSCPKLLAARRDSIMTAYTTATDVVDIAMPAILAASSCQCMTKYANRKAHAKGAEKDKNPMITAGRNCARKTVGSISAPARNVSIRLPKPAKKSIQAFECKPSRLPAATPSKISTSAAARLSLAAMNAPAAANSSHSGAMAHEFSDPSVTLKLLITEIG